MRRLSIGCLLVATLLSLGGVVVGGAQAREPGSDKPMMIALDLMDLDIPGEGGGDQLELPPIEEPMSPVEEATPSIPEPEPAVVERTQQKPVVVERTQTEMPGARSPVLSPLPGIAPFLLEESGRGTGTTKAATKPAETRDLGTALQEIPAELKTVPPPPSRAGSLKLPSGTDVGVAGEADLPEIPLLKGEDREQQGPVPGGYGSGLTMKPMQGLDGTPVVRQDVRSSQQARQAEDYLQVREDFDSRLFEIYESFYKKR